MEQTVKTKIKACVTELKDICITNGLSIGFDIKNGDLLFFNTSDYMANDAYDIVKVNLQKMVKDNYGGTKWVKI